MTATILSIDPVTADGTYIAGDIIQFTLTLSEDIQEATAAGGSVTVYLDTGQDITVTVPAATSTISFSYVIPTGVNSPDLNVTGVAFNNLETVAGDPVSGTLPSGQNLADNADLVIDTTSDAGGDLAVTLAADASGTANDGILIDGLGAVGFTVAGLDAATTATITFTDSAGTMHTETANADGSFTADLATAGFVDGVVTVAITAADDAGNPVANGTGASFAIDTTPPTVPTVDDLTTNVAEPTLTGTADDEVGNVTTVTVGGATYTVAVTSGMWSLDLSTATPDSGSLALNDVMGNGTSPMIGTNEVVVTTTDAAGNSVSDASTLELFIDTETPLVTAADLSDTVIEDVTPGHALTGDIDFVDAPSTASPPSVGVASAGGGVGFIGVFQATLPDDGLGDGAGRVTWTFDFTGPNAAADLATLDSLGYYETLTQSYDIILTDEDGNFFEETVVITIQGTNDQPTITGGPALEMLTETDAALTETGTFAIDDIDELNTADILSVNTGLPGDIVVSGNQGTLTDADLHNMFTVTLDSQSQVTWDFASGAADFDYLATNETVTVQFDVNVVDDSGDSYSDTATETVTITITGTNDAAVISGNTDNSGDAVTEDGIDGVGAAIGDDTATGALVSNDVDNPNTFTAETIVGTYGSLTIDATGAWTYTLDNTAGSAADMLNANQPASDVIEVESIDGTKQDITISIVGSNDAAMIMGDIDNSTDAVIEAGVDNAQSAIGDNVATGTLTHTDVDDGNNDNIFKASTLTGAYGTLELLANGNWTYTLDDTSGSAADLLDETQSDNDIFTVKAEDGTDQSITIIVQGSNDAAVITGNVAGTVVETGVDGSGSAVGTSGGMITGLLMSTDIDTVDADNSFTPDSLTGDYGSFTINAAGMWTYTLTNSNADVEALNVGDDLTETFTVTTTDGTPQDVVVTIDGRNDAPTISAVNLTGANGVFDTDANDSFADLTGSLAGTDIDNDGASLVHVLTGMGVDSSVTGQTSMDLVHNSVVYGVMTLLEDGSYTINLDDDAINALDENDFFQLMQSFTVSDGASPPVQQTLTLDITGANDLPILTDSSGNILPNTVLGDVTEDASDPNLTTSGLIFFDDAEIADTHIVTVQQTAPGSLGLMSGAQIATATGAVNVGQIQWTYTVPNSAVQYLAQDEEYTESFDVSITDDSGGSFMTTIDVTITGENDLPTFSIVGTDSASGSATEAGANLMATGTITIGDVDVIDTASVSLDAANALSIDGSGADSSIDIAALETALANALTFTGDIDASSTSANVAWAFDSGAVDFDDLGDGESLVLTYTIQVTDGEGATNAAPQTIDITINGTNDAPNLTVDSNNVTLDEGGTVVLSTAMLAASDVDAADGAAELVYTVVTNVANGQLFIDTDGSGVLDNGEVALVANDTFTQADIDNGDVLYTHDGSQNFADSVNISVSDDGIGSNDSADVSGTLNFLASNVNDAPVGTVTITGTAQQNETLLASNNLTDEDGLGTISYEWFADGTSVGTGQTFTLTQSEVGAMMTVVASYTDGFGEAEAVSSTPTTAVVNVNDAPEGTDATLSINEDEPHTFEASDFGFADNVDVPANILDVVIITSLPTAGTLELNGAAVAMGDSISVADIDAELLVFTPDANANGTGYSSFTFHVVDDGGVANGGQDTDQSANTMTFDVAAVNDAPTVTGPNLTISEGQTVGINNLHLGIADVDDTDTNVAISVTNVSGGDFLIAGSTVTSFTLAQVMAGDVSFAHDGNEAAPTFDVTATDDDSAASTTESATITFTNVNDTPTVTAPNLTITEGQTVGITNVELGVADVDDADANITISVTNVSGGDFLIAGSAVTSFTLAQVIAGDVSFAHDGNEAAPTFDVTATDDDTAASTTESASITFTNNNDAPEGTDATLSINEDEPHTFEASDFGFADNVDVPANVLDAVIITALPTAGTLTLNGVAVAMGDSISVADIDAELLVFTPDANANGTGYSSFTFQVVDDGGVANGGQDTDQSANTLTFDVAAVNDAPVIDEGASDITPSGDEDMAITGTIVANDVEDATLTYSIASGDGPSNGSVMITGNSFSYTGNQDYNGPDAFTVTVTDSVGATDTVVVNVTVDPVDDVVDVDVSGVSPSTHDETIDAAVPVPTFFATGTTVTDVDAEDFDGGVLNVAVTGGDATDLLNLTDTADVTISGANVLIAGTVIGTVSGADTNNLSVTFNTMAYAEDVEAVIEALNYVTASDQPVSSRDITIDLSNGDTPGTALQETISVAITASNDSPIATDDGNSDANAAGGIRVTENSTSTFNILFGGSTGVIADSDPDHDVTELAVISADGNAVTSAVPAIITTSMDALVTIRSNGLVDYNISPSTSTLAFQALAQGETATDSFTYTIADPDGAQSTATVYVTIVGENDAVDAQDDTITVAENGAGLTGNVTDNDEDIDVGDTFEVVNVQNGPNTTTVADGNGGFIVTLTGGADPITVQVNSDGSYSVDIPESLNAGETINGGFNYTVEDTGGAQSFATVTLAISGENDGPTVSAPINLGSTDEDTVFVITEADLLANSDDVDSNSVLNVLNLVASSGNLVDNMDGTWSFTPDLHDDTNVNFSFDVSDGIATPVSTSATLDLTPVNDAPVIDAGASDVAVTADEDNAVAGTIVASDVDDATLTYSAVDGANGTVTIDGSGGYIYTPADDFNGTDSFVVTVTDAAGFTDDITVNVTINAVNDAPVIDAGASDVAVTADEDNAVAGTIVASDVDDATLTYSAVDGANGTVTIDGSGGYIYTPADDFNGTDSFVVTVTDAAGLTDDITVNVTINAVNDAPVIDASASDDNISGDEDTVVTGTIVASDVEGSTITYTAGDGDYGTVTIDEFGAYTYTPNPDFNGNDNFVVTVFDGDLSDTIVINVTVNPVDDASVVSGDFSGSVTEGDIGDPPVTVQGTIDITDIDVGDTPSFNDVASTVGDNGLGLFELTNGEWTFTLDQSAAAVNDLDDGDVAFDSITFAADDGTEQIITVTVMGSNNNLIGTANDDVLVGSDGIDVINGLAGNDTINSGDADDVIDGGAGDDILDGMGGDDNLTGGSGADAINGGSGTDEARYDDSDAGVTINLVNGAAIGIGGHAQDDVLDSIENLFGSSFADTLTGDDFNNVIDGFTGDDIIDGGAGNDNLSGRAGIDMLSGGDGNDIVSGGNEDDIIDGGMGDDTLRGDGGNDAITGGAGMDSISAGTGNDMVHGGDGIDNILGQGGDDILYGDAGADQLRGGSGNDTLFGGDDDDMLFGQGNNDILHGEGGDDRLSGGAGSDELYGGDGNDVLTGFIGADRLDGGAGNDVLHGGAMDGARDTFVFAEGYDQDRINAFDQAGTDRLELDDALWAGVGTLTAQEVVDMFGSLNATGTILTLDFGNGDILEIQNADGIDIDTFGEDILVI